ncbi:MAG: restriction endonuclease [Lachnospiraceae bacterium]|nr:restriction endonuclease [Lachnospiraceae bacterium]MBO5146079.1 restriction endonuclease [Lachnospiraceae bacterium]
MAELQTSTQLLLLAAVIAGLILIVTAGVLLCRQFRKNARARELDGMDGFDFEYYCADLLAANGFVEVQVTQSSGDYGIDILAEKDGVTYAIQCKRYTGLVGVKAVQEAYAGRDYYDRMVGAVLTNQYFTKPAAEAARKLKILLWDRDYIQAMEEE